MPRVLACTDGSIYATSVYDHAAWAAERLGGASVQVLHVLDRAAAAATPADRSGTIGFDASEELLRELAEVDAERGRVALRRARALLAEAERRLRAAGVAEVALAQRHGSVVEAVAESEAGADLVVIGKRGEAADFAVGHLGANLERVVRASARPVLVASRAFRPIGRVLIAYDGGPAASKAVHYTASRTVLKGLDCHVVAVAPQGGGGTLDRPGGCCAAAGWR